MKEKIMTHALILGGRRNNLVVKRRKIGTPSCIDMVAELKKFTEDHKLCPKRDAVLPVRPPPSCQDKADHDDHVGSGKRHLCSQEMGREEI